jgi:hypothetical protein
MTTVYSTETPRIDTTRYSFDYPTKRSAYVDALHACMEINRAAKTAPDNIRIYLYKIKRRWLQRLYEQGFCVRAEQDMWWNWELTYLVDGIVFRFHLLERHATWPIRENKAPVFYDWQDNLPRPQRPLSESVALLEYVLAR